MHENIMNTTDMAAYLFHQGTNYFSYEYMGCHEIVLDDISSGASQDIAHATNIAHAMVCAYGMSEKLGRRR